MRDDARSVLDLFSAAAGGWSLGMHNAGFHTVAACEAIDWRRTLYSENNPGVPVYDDVRTLTAARLLADLGSLPRIVVGSPPCQDISSANTKGKGVEGERSGLFFEAVRIIGEVRPRWFALENSANLRTRGADRVIAALAAIGYACWAFVVGADDIGANHERKRSWLIGYDPAQLDGDAYGELSATRIGAAATQGSPDLARGSVRPDADASGDGSFPAADTDGIGWDEERSRRRLGLDVSAAAHSGRTDASNADSDAIRLAELPRRPEQEAAVAHDAAGDASQDGRRQGLPGRRAGAVAGAEQPACRDALDAAGFGHEGGRARRYGPDGDGEASASTGAGNPPDPDQAGQAGQADGCMVARIRQAEIAVDGRGSGRRDDEPRAGQVGLCAPDRRAAFRGRPDWSLADLADHLRLDAGLSAWLAGTRVAVGGPRGTAAASLIVEAFGDAVVPQIPEAIGRAILRVEAAMAAVSGRVAA